MFGPMKEALRGRFSSHEVTGAAQKLVKDATTKLIFLT
jgi:hypothetical protein